MPGLATTRRRWAVLLTAATLLASLLAAGPLASTAGASGLPYVKGGRTVPTYSYQDAIHQSVYVQTSMDSDHNGRPDRIAADIVRPRTNGTKVPVIMEASPYYSCCGRGNENQVKGYTRHGVIDDMPLYYDNYFVPRGYAFVGVDLTGTNRSTGCVDTGGPAEVQGAKAVIDWLEGRTKAYDTAGRQVMANWTTGKVGMIGKSWDGSIANGVAATGVQGLTTIVPVSGISSWYDYTRFNGVLRSPGYVKFLDSYVSGRPKQACATEFARQQRASSDATGNFNGFWAARDYRLSVSSVHASVFVAHGINDQNVTTNQFGQWWDLLAKRGVPRKIWLSQTSHVDPFDYRRAAWVNELHKWFDYWLQGLHNGVMAEPQATIQRTDGTWRQQSSWPAAGTSDRAVRLGGRAGQPGVLGGRSTATESIADAPKQSEAAAVADPSTVRSGRLAFLSAPLTHALHISGAPSVTLRIKVDKPTTELTAKLVDYGEQHRVDYQNAGEGIVTGSTRTCWGESSATDSACYLTTSMAYTDSATEVLARGWQDAAHHVSLTRTTPLQPGRWYTVTVPLDDYEAIVAPGHTLGLVLTLTDEEFTSPQTTGATVHIRLGGSSLTLPVAGPGLPSAPSTVPSVSAPAQPTAPRAATVRLP